MPRGRSRVGRPQWQLVQTRLVELAQQVDQFDFQPAQFLDRTEAGVGRHGAKAQATGLQLAGELLGPLGQHRPVGLQQGGQVLGGVGGGQFG